MPFSTLRLSFPDLRVPLASLLLMGIVMLSIELVARNSSRQSWLPTPTVGGGYDAFDFKLMQLERFVKNGGQIECFFVGNSAVNVGLSPAIFSQAYQQRGGDPLSCYNFGIVGMPPNTVAATIRMLVDRYHPKLIIYGITLTQFSTQQWDAENISARFAATAWMQYYQGHFTLKGWLIDKFYSLRYVNGIPAFLFPDMNLGGGRFSTEMGVYSERGYGPNLDFSRPAPIFKWRSNSHYNVEADEQEAFTPSEAAFAAFDQVLELSPSTHLIIFEMPNYNFAEHYFDPSGTSDRPVIEQVSDRLAADAHDHGAVFWSSYAYHLIDDFYWSDPIHPHILGTAVLSDWLGQQVGEAERLGLWGAESPWRRQPPIANLVVKPHYVDSLGLSGAHYQAFLVYLAQFDSVPAEAIAFNPAQEENDRQFLQTTAGVYLENAWYKGKLPEFEGFDLLAALDRMRYEEELSLPLDQQAALDRWRTSKRPEDLLAAGFSYLIYTDLWYRWTSDQESAMLGDPNNYELIGTWTHPTLLETYFLYRVVGA